ncbi:MAG: helix-turn-helix domain-containing protein, partial [Ktedonobacteraceae bacterium]
MNEEDSFLPTLPLPGYITVKEAAKMLGLAEKTIYGYVDEGKLPAIRVASSILVEEEAAQNYKRQSAGRPRTRIPTWRIPTGANLQYLTYISVNVRPNQGD